MPQLPRWSAEDEEVKYGPFSDGEADTVSRILSTHLSLLYLQLSTRIYKYLQTGSLDWTAVISSLDACPPRTVVVLHAQVSAKNICTEVSKIFAGTQPYRR